VRGNRVETLLDASDELTGHGLLADDQERGKKSKSDFGVRVLQNYSLAWYGEDLKGWRKKGKGSARFVCGEKLLSRESYVATETEVVVSRPVTRRNTEFQRICRDKVGEHNPNGANIVILRFDAQSLQLRQGKRVLVPVEGDRKDEERLGE